MADVFSHPALGFFGFLLAQGFHKMSMLGQRSLHPAGYPYGGQAKDADVVVEGRDQINQPPGIGKHDDRLMKLEIFAGVSAGIFFAEGLLEPLKAGLQLGQGRFAGIPRGQIGGQTFQVFPDQKELEDVFFRKLDDEGTPLGKDFDQPLFLQPVDGLTHGRPADPQGTRQTPFIQLASRRNLAFQNEAFQFLVGLVPERELRMLDLLHATFLIDPKIV